MFSLWWEGLNFTVVRSGFKLLRIRGTSFVAQLVKNLPALQETRIQPLSREDPLKKEMVTHSSILAWKVPQTEEPGGL